MTDMLVGFNPPDGLVKAREVLFRENPEYFGLVHGKRVLSGNDLRGKGIVEPYIYVMRQGKREFGKKAFRAVPDRWTEVSYPIRADVPGVKKFFILIHTGYVDLDDISLEPVKNP